MKKAPTAEHRMEANETRAADTSIADGWHRARQGDNRRNASRIGGQAVGVAVRVDTAQKNRLSR